MTTITREASGHIWTPTYRSGYTQWTSPTCSVQITSSTATNGIESFSVSYKGFSPSYRDFYDAAGWAAEHHARDVQAAREFLQRYGVKV